MPQTCRPRLARLQTCTVARRSSARKRRNSSGVSATCVCARLSWACPRTGPSTSSGAAVHRLVQLFCLTLLPLVPGQDAPRYQRRHPHRQGTCRRAALIPHLPRPGAVSSLSARLHECKPVLCPDRGLGPVAAERHLSHHRPAWRLVWLAHALLQVLH